MSFNFNFGGMPNMDLGNIQVPNFSPQDYNFDGGIGQFGQEAMDKRQEANEARNSAKTQYEADVADFKDREATEAEDTLSNLINEAGIGGLMPPGTPSFGDPPLQTQHELSPFTEDDPYGTAGWLDFYSPENQEAMFDPPPTVVDPPPPPFDPPPPPFDPVPPPPPFDPVPPPPPFDPPFDPEPMFEIPPVFNQPTPPFDPPPPPFDPPFDPEPMFETPPVFNQPTPPFDPPSPVTPRFDPVDNWGEPGYEVYEPAAEIIDPIEDFVTDPVSPFIDTNPFNDIWEAPVAEVTDNVGAGAGGDPTTDFAPINNPFDPVDNWGEPGYEIYDPADEIIDPIEDFVTDPVSPFIDTNPFNDIWDAPVVEVTPNVGVGAGGDPSTDFVPINNPFEPVETDYDPVRDDGIIDPGAPDPGTGWWDDPDEPGPDQDYWDEDEGIYEPPIDIPPPPAPPPPIYTPPPPPPMVTGPTATPMNRLIAMQTGMFGGQPQGQYRPYEEPSATTYLNQPTNPRLIMHGNSGGSIQQPTRNLKKLFSNPLDKGLGQLPVMGQNDTLTQTVQAGFRPRR